MSTRFFIFKLILSCSILFPPFFAIAGTFNSEKEFKEFIQKNLVGKTDVNSFVDAFSMYSPNAKAAMKAWAKKHQVTSVPKISIRGSDVGFEMNGQKAKLTITDFKRSRFHINGEVFSSNSADNMNDYLDNVLNQLQPAKSAALFFGMNVAYADSGSTNAALALSSGAVALAEDCMIKMFCNYGKELIESIKKENGLRFKELKCNQVVDASEKKLTLTLQRPSATDNPNDNDAELEEVVIDYSYPLGTMQSQQLAKTSKTVQPIKAKYASEPKYSGLAKAAEPTASEKEIVRYAFECCKSKKCLSQVDEALGKWRGRPEPIKNAQPYRRTNR